jgi:hypothetical protein
MSYVLDTPFQNQVIFLDSQNATSKTIDGVGEYVYSFKQPLTVPSNCDVLFSVTDAQFPNTIPNITSSNNQISFSVPTFSKFFTITLAEDDGETDMVYSVSEWLSYVNAKIIIEAVGQFTLYGEFFANNSKIKWFCNYPFSIINNTNYPTTCMDLIGGAKNHDGSLKYFSDGILLSSVVSPSYHITMPSTVNFSGTRFIFLKFKNISVNNLNSDGFPDESVVRIDNNAPYGYFIFYRPMEVHRFLMHKRGIHNIIFRLTDTKGNDLNIWSADSQITLKIEFVYKPKLRSMEEGTISYELRKLAKIAKIQTEEFEGTYNPETNSFERN